MFYFILMGDFGDYTTAMSEKALTENIFFLIFFVVSVLFIIVMLNLLIAIISDSYDKVIAMEGMASVYERLQMIVNRESLMMSSSRNQMNQRKKENFLYIVSKQRGDEDNENADERIRSKVESVERLARKNEKEMELIKKALKDLELRMHNDLKSFKDEIKLTLIEALKQK